MTPTIVLKDNQLFLVTGSPGGSRIITTVLQILLNVMEFDMNIAQGTVSSRIHHQWLPDKLFIEDGINVDTRHLLMEKGHNLTITNSMGSTHSIMKIDDFLYGYSDPRRRESLTAGY